MKRMTRWMCGVGALTLVGAVPIAAQEATPSPGVERDSAQGMGGSARENPIQKDQDMQSSKTTQESEGMQASKPDTYVVEKGDTLATIAERKLGSADEWKVIAQANGIDDPDALRVGQKLEIPSDAGKASGTEEDEASAAHQARPKSSM